MTRKNKITYAARPPSRVEWGVVESPAGKLVVGVTGKSEICRIHFLRKEKPAAIIGQWQSEWPQTQFLRGAVVVDFDRQTVLMVGTPFQCKVWRAMMQIPAGQVMTYGAVARRIGHAKAVRAVGSACGKNPVPYLVPCHRILAANGLGGFSSGLDMKKKLLEAESVL